MMFHKQNQLFDVNTFSEIHEDILKEFEYKWHRYNVNYCMVILKLEENVINQKEMLKKNIRATDKYIELDNGYHILMLGHTKLQEASRALLKIQRLIMIEQNLMHLHTIVFAKAIEVNYQFNLQDALHSLALFSIDKKNPIDLLDIYN